MIIALVGYMTCGKTHWAKQLSENTDLAFVDLDTFLESAFLHATIQQFITEQGELAFRKAERKALETVLQMENIVLATGGGTPCYYDNMAMLNMKATTVFLDTSLQTLAARLQLNREARPLLAHLQDAEVKEFVAKHLFERKPFYYQAKYVLAENQINISQLLHIYNTNNA